MVGDVDPVEHHTGGKQDAQLDETDDDPVQELACQDLGPGDRRGQDPVEEAGLLFVEECDRRGGQGEQEELHGPAAHERGSDRLLDLLSGNLLGVDRHQP